MSPGSVINHSKCNLLRFNTKASNFIIGEDEEYNPLKLRHSGFEDEIVTNTNEDSTQQRKINKMPFKVLDAPQLQDDFYLNLVDWSNQNVLAVGLNRSVYIWSASTSIVKKLCETPIDDMITSVGWSNKGQHLAVGTNSGETEIWDTNHCKIVRTLNGHLGRVSAVAWNGSIVSTGSRDRMVLTRDLRCKDSII